PQEGLAIALSPDMGAASTSSSAGHARVPTPLSPLHLNPAHAVNGTAGGGMPVWQAPGAGTVLTPPTRPGSAMSGSVSTGASLPASPPQHSPMLQHRGSLTRGSSAGGMLVGAMHPAVAAMYQQRLLIWRVVRTLSPDPFPAVARVAQA